MSETRSSGVPENLAVGDSVTLLTASGRLMTTEIGDEKAAARRGVAVRSKWLVKKLLKRELVLRHEATGDERRIKRADVVHVHIHETRP